MSADTHPSPLREEDYEAIESAVMETARGRWFLAEYTRRNKAADTDALLAAIARLESNVVKDRGAPAADRIRLDLVDMALAIERAKQEIARIKTERAEAEPFDMEAGAFEGVARQAEDASSKILEAIESIQETAWTIRESGSNEAACDTLDAKATDIYSACAIQDLAGKRVHRAMELLGDLEDRINRAIDLEAGEDATAGGKTEVEHDLAAGLDDLMLVTPPDIDWAGEPAEVIDVEADIEPVAGEGAGEPASEETVETVDDADAFEAAVEGLAGDEAPAAVATEDDDAADPIEELSTAERRLLFQA